MYPRPAEWSDLIGRNDDVLYPRPGEWSDVIGRRDRWSVLQAKRTGRAIPEWLFKQAFEASDKTLKILTPKVNFVARIDNEKRTPFLEAFEVVDQSHSWEVIGDIFGLTILNLLLRSVTRTSTTSYHYGILEDA